MGARYGHNFASFEVHFHRALVRAAKAAIQLYRARIVRCEG